MSPSQPSVQPWSSLQSNVVVEAGHNTATVTLVASERGTEYNGLTGTVELVDAIAWVSEVAIVGESSGGVNQETDEEYENRLAGALALQAPRPITAADFATMAFDAPTSTIGASVGRATAIDGYNPEAATYGNERTVCVFAVNAQGLALTSEARTKLKEWLQGYRELNFVIFVWDASRTKLYVTTQVHCLPGYSSEAVAANVKAALLSYINPASWGNPSAQTTGVNSWLNSTAGFNVVRINKLINICESVPGVDYVPVGQLKLGTAPSPAGTVDVTLAGPAPLPESESATILVSAV